MNKLPLQSVSKSSLCLARGPRRGRSRGSRAFRSIPFQVAVDAGEVCAADRAGTCAASKVSALPVSKPYFSGILSRVRVQRLLDAECRSADRIQHKYLTEHREERETRRRPIRDHHRCGGGRFGGPDAIIAATSAMIGPVPSQTPRPAACRPRLKAKKKVEFSPIFGLDGPP
jgi:hypothetical protein